MSVRTQRLSMESAEPGSGVGTPARACVRDSAGWIASGRQMAARLHRRQEPADRIAELEQEVERLQALLAAAQEERLAGGRAIASARATPAPHQKGGAL